MLVMNQVLDSKLTEENDEEKKGSKTIEKQENDTMFYGIVSRCLIQKKVL